MVNVCTIVTGRTLNAHKAFVDNLAFKIHLTEVTLDECDVILEFCPISSRPGTDIDAALGKIPADKPVILVVMHHISDPNHRLYPSSNFVTQSNVFTVDCLFHEAKGFFKSTANDTAVEQTLEHMRKYAKERPPPAQKPAENSPQNPHPAPDVTPTQQGENKVPPENITAWGKFWNNVVRRWNPWSSGSVV
ncbi:hypothetical protein SKAU_G00186000 [Synaphobranchus kaupii]|uniref:Uncharacterized protein n=1 Tax=Synaphobranchus kaupii TaxID=118154 RepID=A0A9Q1FCS0_SYNKA|nr:hypothetical protein SKAU_G00186000 [Synaphobranchus kaupii]